MRHGVARLAAAVLVAGACSSDGEPHGSPILTQVYWNAGVTRTLVWTLAPDPTLSSTAPPAGSEIDFVFDRRLDGSKIEDTVNGSNGPVPVPKANPPITVSWPDAATAMSDPPFADQVFYNSVPIFGGQTAYVFLTPIVPGFPSSDTVTFALDKTGLTSAYGDPMSGPAQISVTTAPFTATFNLPGGADGGASVPADFMVPIEFSNRPAALSALAPYVSATSGGATLPIALAFDGNDPTVVLASPASCLSGWPSGAPILLTVAAGFPDAFGGPLAADAMARFSASGGPSSITDGGCVVADAGAD